MMSEIEYMPKIQYIGCDEVGFGALCGNLTIGAVRALKDWSIPGLNDSKKLTDKQRRIMADKIYLCYLNGDIQIAIAERSSKHIDKFGVIVSLKECYKEAAQKLYSQDSLIVIDGNINFDEVLAKMDYQTIIRADTFIPTVMAASILAKVYRDDQMIKLAGQFPVYHWSENKGYGSKLHLDAIKKYGYTEFHRQSYKLKSQ